MKKMNLNKTKKTAYPTKTTLNLCVRERVSLPIGKALPLILVIVLLAGVFGKFAVADRLEKVRVLESEAYAVEAQRDVLMLELRDYADVQEQYNKYSLSWMDASEQNLLPRSEMLDLLQTMLMPRCGVQQFSANDNTMSVTLSNITLDETSKLVQDLYALNHVTNVAVYTASTEEEDSAKQATVSMVITMGHEEEGGDGS